MSDLITEQSLPTALIVLLTFLSPYITALFTRTSMSPKAKQLIAVAVAAVIAVVYVLLNGGVDSWEKFFVAAPTIYALGNIIYGLLLKNSVKIVEATKGLTDPSVVEDEAIVTEKEEKVALEEAAAPSEPVIVKPAEESPAKG